MLYGMMLFFPPYIVRKAKETVLEEKEISKTIWKRLISAEGEATCVSLAPIILRTLIFLTLIKLVENG